MKRFWFLTLVVVVVFSLMFIAGCGTNVEVPPGHVGKKATDSGLSSKIIYPKKLRLSDFCLNCNDLVLAEVADYPVKEKMTIFMPEDELNLTVDTRTVLAVSDSEETIDSIYARLSPKPTPDNRVKIIKMKKIYRTYGEPVIREVVRSELTKYSINEVMANRDKINANLKKRIAKRLESTPLKVPQFGLADIQPPKVILDAKEAAKRRQIKIHEAEAQKKIDLKKAEAALEVAKKQQQVDLKEAETQVLVNKKLAEGVNPAFVTQRSLKVLEKMSQSNNKVFFLTEDVLQNPAMLLGSMYQEKK